MNAVGVAVEIAPQAADRAEGTGALPEGFVRSPSRILPLARLPVDECDLVGIEVAGGLESVRLLPRPDRPARGTPEDAVNAPGVVSEPGEVLLDPSPLGAGEAKPHFGFPGRAQRCITQPDDPLPGCGRMGATGPGGEELLVKRQLVDPADEPPDSVLPHRLEIGRGGARSKAPSFRDEAGRLHAGRQRHAERGEITPFGHGTGDKIENRVGHPREHEHRIRQPPEGRGIDGVGAGEHHHRPPRMLGGRVENDTQRQGTTRSAGRPSPPRIDRQKPACSGRLDEPARQNGNEPVAFLGLRERFVQEVAHLHAVHIAPRDHPESRARERPLHGVDPVGPLHPGQGAVAIVADEKGHILRQHRPGEAGQADKRRREEERHGEAPPPPSPDCPLHGVSPELKVSRILADRRSPCRHWAGCPFRRV